MADQIELEVVTPEKQLVHEQVTEVQIPGKNGYMGVLPGHAPLLSILGSGYLSYMQGSQKKVLAVHGGFVEILPDQVRVLANLAERAEDIDLESARAALKTVTEKLMASSGSGIDPAITLEESELARARVSAAELK